MPRRFRISISPEVGGIVDSIEAIEAFAREHGSGRYEVQEHPVGPFPGSKVAAKAPAPPRQDLHRSGQPGV